MKRAPISPKRHLLIPILLACSISVVFAEAGVSERVYGGCGNYKKYVSDAKGKKCGAFAVYRAKDTGCNWAESWVELLFCGSGAPVRIGEARPYTPYSNGSYFIGTVGLARSRIERNRIQLLSQGGYGSYSDGGLCSPTGWMCMGSDNRSLVFPVTSPTFTSDEQSKAVRRVSVDTGERTYDVDSRTLVIRNFRAVLRNNPDDKINEFSAFYLSLAKSGNNQQDSLLRNDNAFYGERVVSQSRVLLRNG